MDIFDISYIDIDELGAHPFNWTDDANDADIDSKINEYFDKEKTIDLQVLNNEKKLTTEEEDTSMFYDDDPTYETDPETGKYNIRFFYSFRSLSRKIICILISFIYLLCLSS